FDDLERLAVFAENGVIAGLDPDFLAVAAEALVFGGLELAAAQGFPELTVFHAVAVWLVDEHGMVVGLDLVERITDSRAEILIDVQDIAVEIELDHGLRFVECRQLGAKFARAQLGFYSGQ